MAKIATCPNCAKQLGLPNSISTTDRVECPECHSAFSLSEAIQIKLPVAQILAPVLVEKKKKKTEKSPVETGFLEAGFLETGPPAKTTVLADLPSQPQPMQPMQQSTAQPKFAAEAPTTLASNNRRAATPLQQSWEERLRNVLAKGDTPESLPPSEQVAATPVRKPQRPAAKKVVVAPLSETESKGLPQSPPVGVQRPVASEQSKDFGTCSKSQLLDRKLQEVTPQMAMVAPTPQRQPPERQLPERQLPERKSPEGKASKGKTPAPIPKQTNTAKQASNVAEAPPKKRTVATPPPVVEAAEMAEVSPEIIPRRRLARTGFPKVAAFAVGPVAGCLVGFYGLLWLQGTRADHLGLGRILPVAMLPERAHEKHDAMNLNAVASASTADFETDAESNADAETDTDIETDTEAESVALASIKRDSAVRPASVDMPAQRLSAAVQIRVAEFVARVDVAAVALPELIAGDFSTRESIRTKGQAYMALCRLAEQFEITQQSGLSPADQAKVRSAKSFFRQAAEQASLREELSHIAGQWWEYADRANPGIFLTGRVVATQASSEDTLCWVKLSAQNTVAAIPVLFKQRGPEKGDLLGVVGSVTANPTPPLPGFTGPQMVVAAYYFSLPAAP